MYLLSALLPPKVVRQSTVWAVTTLHSDLFHSVTFGHIAKLTADCMFSVGSVEFGVDFEGAIICSGVLAFRAVLVLSQGLGADIFHSIIYIL